MSTYLFAVVRNDAAVGTTASQMNEDLTIDGLRSREIASQSRFLVEAIRNLIVVVAVLDSGCRTLFLKGIPPLNILVLDTWVV